MTVGVDLRIFQIGHQYRGIGSHIKSLFREISKMKEQPSFVLYEYPNVDSGLDFIKEYLPKLDYEIRHTEPLYTGPSFLERIKVSHRERNTMGHAGLKDFSGVDVMLCVDFNLGVPRPSMVKTVLISYDMIPWVFSSLYLPNFFQVFSRTRDPRRALKAHIEKVMYFQKIKQANHRAVKILSISEHTKKDLVKYLRIKPEKIEPVPLGIDKATHRKRKTSVSALTINGKKTTLNLTKNQYLFFMGGADRRRRVEYLVTAFETVADKNPDTKLILAGYDFQNIDTVPDHTTKDAINTARHKDRIYFAGFVSDEERSGLFAHAIAYVFPSVYEGFGLVILEAMDQQCPVITFNNSSIAEVGGTDAVLYAEENAQSIAEQTKRLIDDPSLRKKLIARGKKQIDAFPWSKTAKDTVHALKNVASD